MIAGRHSEDYQPLTWIGRMPLYATTLLVISYVVTFIAGAILVGAGQPNTLNDFAFIASWDGIRNFELWRFVTYAFVNDPHNALWFAIEMYLLYSFGREVERFLGRRAFLLLYTALLLAPPVIFTLLSFAGIPSGPVLIQGSFAVNFAVFVAFVVIYPEAQIFFSLKAKWVALVLLAVYTVQLAMPPRDMARLAQLWMECAGAVVMLRLSGVTNASFERWLPEREEPRTIRRRRKAVAKAAAPEPDVHDSIDPLLEKISQHGIGSLTRSERQRLERARAALIEQEKRNS